MSPENLTSEACTPFPDEDEGEDEEQDSHTTAINLNSMEEEEDGTSHLRTSSSSFLTEENHQNNEDRRPDSPGSQGSSSRKINNERNRVDKEEDSISNGISDKKCLSGLQNGINEEGNSNQEYNQGNETTTRKESEDALVDGDQTEEDEAGDSDDQEPFKPREQDDPGLEQESIRKYLSRMDTAVIFPEPVPSIQEPGVGNGPSKRGVRSREKPRGGAKAATSAQSKYLSFLYITLVMYESSESSPDVIQVYHILSRVLLRRRPGGHVEWISRVRLFAGNPYVFHIISCPVINACFVCTFSFRGQRHTRVG